MAVPAHPAPEAAAATDDPHIRTRLLNAAVRVFDRKGYAGASVREIAELAGVTKPTLYYHFGSKEGLLVAILTQAQREFTALVGRALARQGPVGERIVALCEDAFDLLANDDMRGYRIEVETDSTIQPDEDAEKQRRTEFVTAIGGLLQQAVPLLGAAPELAPLVGETILFTARGFRAGRQLEDVIEQAFKAVQDRLSQPPPQQPDPNAAMLQAKQKEKEMDLQFK